ncbi:hypothetical protein FQR65_LT10875 [Abscondita terminalis]|nr:hypothetical protein FQR65_LT10875 [Abscondita terminalis]
MYSTESFKPRKKNPRENANWISLITFFFALKIFRKFHSGNVQEQDVYEVMPSFRSEKLGNLLETQWENEKRNFLKSLVKLFWKKLAYWGMSLAIIDTITMIIYPLLLGKLVSYFTPGQTEIDLNKAVLYTFELVIMILFYTFYIQSYVLSIMELALKAKIACCSLIYRKCLKLNLITLNESINGLVVTIISKDINQIENTIDIVLMNFSGSLQVILMIYMMYNEIGVASLAGSSLLIIMMPIQVLLGRLTSKYRLKSASKTDQRVKVTQEILTAIRIIKMYTWELFFSKSVHKLRRMEIRSLRILFYIKAIAVSIGQLSSRLAFYICVMTYIAMGNHITAERAFVVIGCFGSVRAVLTSYMPLGVSQIAEMKASLKRITYFLTLEEVNVVEDFGSVNDVRILVNNVSFKKSNDLVLFDKVNFEIRTKGLTLLMGPTGSGKSTLLKFILEDCSPTSGVVRVSGSKSYASQEPWIFPATVRQNILFGETFERNRYNHVIDVCALNKDIESLPFGDKTLLTDYGLNLSKGQKARINLARAVYKNADIYILDDPLSSVDYGVANHIFTECIRTFLKDRICIFVTHNTQLISLADDLILLNEGVVTLHNSYKKSDDSFINNEKYFEVNNFVNSKHLSQLIEEHNVYKELNKIGQVDKKVYLEYFSSAGGLKVFLLVLITFIASQATSSWSDYFVSFWVDMEQELSGFRMNQTTNSSEYAELEKSHDRVMKSYSFVVLAAAILTFLCSFTFFIFSSKASTNIHNTVLDKILKGAMTFFDSNLSGNVLNRFSRDLDIIDDHMPGTILNCLNVILQVVAVFFMVSSVNLYFIVPSVIFTIVLYIAKFLYMPTGRGLRRIEGAIRSPIIGHLSATLDGLTTIRASKAEHILKREFDKLQDLFSSIVCMNIVVTRAFALYLDFICICYIAVITLTFLCFKTDTLAGKVGLAITQSFTLTGILQWGVKSWAALENQMTSTERVLEYKYATVEDTSGNKPDNWPNKGNITFKNVNLTYSTCNERVLKNVSFTVCSKEKIGIVGRTGAGKTSIISTLFRMYDFEGTITIDSVDIKTVSISNLRSKISIIPQDPVLFSGTIRSNLDPQFEHSDETLWKALEQVEMKKYVNDLEDEINKNSSRLSVGEKQLFCLARAIIQNNSVLIMDEATANVDSQTDALVQKTVKKLFSHCTVFTIAHKIHTILDCDKILVMDCGEVIEFGPPQILLANKNGLFYNMVKDSGLQ